MRQCVVKGGHEIKNKMVILGKVKGVISTKNSLERCEEVNKKIDFLIKK